MAFVNVITSGCLRGCQTGADRENNKAKCSQRREFLKLLGAASVGVLLPLAKRESAEASLSDWSAEDLCNYCRGKGKQTCSFCQGSGTLSIDDSLVQYDQTCPNCEGAGLVKCPACIGLGLAEVNGVLRDGSRNGTLRMLKNGSYEILDCSAFPSCDIYGCGSLFPP